MRRIRVLIRVGLLVTLILPKCVSKPVFCYGIASIVPKEHKSVNFDVLKLLNGLRVERHPRTKNKLKNVDPRVKVETFCQKQVF